MVDFARVRNRIYYGYGKAARKLGTTHAIYRSSSPITPIQVSTFVKNTLISLDADFRYDKARKYGDVTWQLLPEDGLTLQNYDYMVSSDGINYYIVDIASVDRLSPPLCIECNAIISIKRPTNSLTPGTNSYQEFQISGGTQIALNCPASIIEHARMEVIPIKIPTSVKLPFYEIGMPILGSSMQINVGDIVTDDSGRQMAVMSAERTKKSLGFRLLAGQLGN